MGDQTQIRGVVESIRLTNINKARGQYTYVVALIVRPREIVPGADTNVQRWVREGKVPATVSIRVDKVYWGSLPPARQAELAPAGPAPTLQVQQYGRHAVGEGLDLAVHFTSPGLADPVSIDP